MRILTIDTSGQTEIVAVVDDGRILASTESPAGRGQSRTLLAAIDDVLTGSSTAIAGLGGIAVSIGPGRFSGLRVGLATAKGLAAERECPVWGVSTLRALAESASKAGTAARWVFAATDARRGEVYGALFERVPGAAMRRATDDAALPPGEAARWAVEQAGGEPVLFVGSGAEAYRDEIVETVGESGAFASIDSLRNGALVLAELAERSGADGAIDSRRLEPAYIRGAVG